MKYTRYRLIEYRSGSASWLDHALALSIDGQLVMPNGSMITATEIDANQITVSLEAKLEEARNRPDEKFAIHVHGRPKED